MKKTLSRYLPRKTLSTAAVLSLLVTGAAIPNTATAAAPLTGEVDVNATESQPIPGPKNPNSLSYSFTTRWNSATKSTQYLGVTMPMSANGMVNVAGIDTDINRQNADDTSQNVLSREFFTDGLERAGESTLTMRNSRQVLIGTTRGELVNVNPNNLRLTKIDVPAGTASSILNMYDAGDDVILGTRSATYRTADNRGSGEVLKLKYDCTYQQCSNEERWTRYGAPVPGNTHVYGATAWRGAVIAASGDSRAMLSIFENGQWRELDSVPATGTGQAERFTQARVTGDYLYASYQGTNEQKAGTHVYRLSQDQDGRVSATWMSKLGGKDKVGWITTPVAPNMGYSPSSVIYRGSSETLMIHDPEAGPNGTTTTWGSFPKNKMPDQIELGALPTSSCWAIPGKLCATWYPGGSDVVLAAPADGSQPETVKRITSVSPNGDEIINSGSRGIARLVKGPGSSGLFASTSYFGHYVRQIDPATHKTTDLPLSSYRDEKGGTPQVESLGAVGDQLLAGTYPFGTIAQIDPTKPVTCEYRIDRSNDACNPTISTNDRVIGLTQARPVDIADLGEGQAAIASYGFRKAITGALTFYDTKTKKITDRVQFKDVPGVKLSQMGLSSVASRNLSETDDWVYAGTNAAPPDNSSTEPRAAIVRYNVKTKRTEALEVPGDKKLVSDLEFGADGRLYAMTGNTFITLDPGLDGKSFRIIDSTDIGPRWQAPGASMTALADGTFAVVAGSGDYYPGPLYLVDPRGEGKPKATALVQNKQGADPNTKSATKVVVIDAPSGTGSRWYYTRGTGIFYQDQPNIAGPLR